MCIHAIPRVCTITEEVNLIKGQRMQAGRFLAAQSDLQDGEQGDLDHCCAANIQHLIVLLSLSVVGADIKKKTTLNYALNLHYNIERYIVR